MYPPDTYPFSFYFLCNYLAAAYPAVLLYDRLAFISIYELVCGDQWLYVLESHLGSTPISARRDESLGARHFAIDHHDASNCGGCVYRLYFCPRRTRRTCAGR